MPEFRKLLTLVTECHERARMEANPLSRAQLRVMADEYWQQAEELKKQLEAGTKAAGTREVSCSPPCFEY